MKRNFIFLFFISFFLFFSLTTVFGKTENNKINYEINGYFNYYSGFFPSSISLTDTTFENSIFYNYFLNLLFNFNSNNKFGFLFNYNGIDWKNPYALGLIYNFFNKAFSISIEYNLKTLDFLKYFSSVRLFLTIDLYPYFFLKVNGSTPFYPEKFILAIPNITSNRLSENFDFSLDTGVYIYQNEVFFQFKYLNIKDFISSSNYYYKLQYYYSAGIRLIPTYTLLGYYFEMGYSINNYNNKFKYSFLSSSIGLIIKPINGLYIKGIIGYNYWYFYTGNLISNENPVFFVLQVNFKTK